MNPFIVGGSDPVWVYCQYQWSNFDLSDWCHCFSSIYSTSMAVVVVCLINWHFRFCCFYLRSVGYRKVPNRMTYGGMDWVLSHIFGDILTAFVYAMKFYLNSVSIASISHSYDSMWERPMVARVASLTVRFLRSAKEFFRVMCHCCGVWLYRFGLGIVSLVCSVINGKFRFGSSLLSVLCAVVFYGSSVRLLCVPLFFCGSQWEWKFKILPPCL